MLIFESFFLFEIYLQWEEVTVFLSQGWILFKLGSIPRKRLFEYYDFNTISRLFWLVHQRVFSLILNLVEDKLRLNLEIYKYFPFDHLYTFSLVHLYLLLIASEQNFEHYSSKYWVKWTLRKLNSSKIFIKINAIYAHCP